MLFLLIKGVVEMKDVIDYLNQHGQSRMANQLISFLDEQEKKKKQDLPKDEFIQFVVKEISQKTPRERILSKLVDEAKKKGFMR